ncbi:MAG: CDC27 family protein [Bacteroidota bacterium]|nr:CDC27 family protein [Bacteroidota bacterium]
MKNSTQHRNPEDYFDYLAELGSSSIQTDDLDDLNERIDNRVRLSSRGAKSNIFTTVLITVFTMVLLFVLFNKTSVLQIGISEKQVVNKKGDILSQAIDNDTVSNIGAYKSDQPIPVVTPKKKEHFVIENRDDHFSEDISIDMLPSRNIALNDSLQNKKITIELIELLPNASVLYIYDLKVTEFQKLYFRKMKPFTIETNGLSAAFENSEAYMAHKNDNKILDPYTLDMLLKDALRSFNKSKYKQSFVLFEELLNYNSNDVNALFYSGLCQFYSGQYSDAISKFSKVTQSENNVFNQEAEWYKALAYQKQGDKKEAIELLLKINKQKGFYADKAAQKLEEIKKNGK